MGLINWIFDFYQQYRIDQLRDDTARTRAEIALRGAGGGGADRLERAIGELALSVKALQRTLVDKGVCSTEELHKTISALDLEDGSADGRAPLPRGS